MLVVLRALDQSLGLHILDPVAKCATLLFGQSMVACLPAHLAAEVLEAQ